MKFCPTCQTRYDEEVLRFCTKDGTPLIVEDQPTFTELPSESAAEAEADDDDFNEVTVIRRNSPTPAEVETTAEGIEETQPLAPPPPPQPRIVIPTVEEKKPPVVLPPPVVQAKTVTEYRNQPKKTNTAKIVLITMLGVITALGAAVFLLMSGDSNRENNANQNTGVNFNQSDTNLNTNLYIGNSTANFGVDAGNTNLNTNFNINAAANLKTPTPRPSATPSATPPPILSSNNNISNSSATPTPTTPANTRPSATPTLPPPPPTSTPPPPPAANTPSNTNRAVNAGVLNGQAVNLPKPAYPPIARQMRASGQVAVQIVVDEAGNVTAAKATTGNALLRAPAEAAARQSKINPIKIGDRSVQAVGILLYNFTNENR